MKKLLITATLVLVWCLKLSAQTDELNHKKYWDLRDRFKKYFVSIGSGDGRSIPISQRTEDYWASPNNAPTLFLGDATSSLGWYIAVLATEYHILIEEGNTQEAQNTLNELYYAIAAINRLDDNAEIYLSRGTITSTMRNGFYLRDDMPELFWNEFNNAQNKYLKDNLQYKTVLSDYFHNSTLNQDPAKFNSANEPSQDQHIALLMGLYFTKELVGSVDVQPTPQDPQLNILSETIGVTDRIMQYMKGYVSLGFDQYFGFVQPGVPCAHTKSFKSNLTIINPVTGEIAGGENSYYIFAQWYPMAEIAHSITGNDYSWDYEFGWDVDGCELAQPRKINLHYSGLEPWNFDEHWLALTAVATPLIGKIAAPILEYASSLSLEDIWYQIRDASQGDGSYSIGGLSVAVDDPDVNFQMHLNLAATSNTWGRPKVIDLSRSRNTQIFMLVYDFVKRIKEIDEYGSRPESGRYSGGSTLPPPALTANLFDYKNEIKSLLDGMDCKGGYIYDVTNRASGGWDIGHRWLHANKSEADKTKSENLHSYFPSLDYLLLYNLYHIAYKLEGERYDSDPDPLTHNIVINKYPLPEYTTKAACPCTDITFDFSQPLQINQEIIERFPHYNSFDMELPEYINTNWEISTGTGLLKVSNTSLVLCNNSTLNLQSSGTLQLGDNIVQSTGNFYVRSGNTLEIEDGNLIINDNSRTIIEEGAILTIHPNSTIQLNGTNAVLEIRGKLEITAGATFQTTGDGYVLFNIQNADPSIAPYNVQASSTSKMVFESADPNKPYKLAVNGGTILYPQPELEEFRADNVGIKLLGAGAGIILSNSFYIQDNYVYGPSSDGFTFTTLTFSPTIKNNTFYSCYRSLTFLGKDKGRDVRIHNNTFENSLNSIVVYETPAHIAGNEFINSGGIFAGSFYHALAPTQGGLYNGDLRVELNKFTNSNALSIQGAFYPHVDFAGNVSMSSTVPNSSNVSGATSTYYAEKSHNTLKCNTFENQAYAIQISSAGSLNLNSQVPSYRALGSGQYVTGGNNFFSNNYKSVIVSSPGLSYDPYTFAYVDLKNGQNSFAAQVANYKSSLIVDRRWNYKGYNYALDPNGDFVINDNFWTPLEGTFNYPSGFPSNVIEKNASSGGHHFNIYEYQSPNYIVGTNVAPPSTCPAPVWSDAINSPSSFDPRQVAGFSLTFVNPDGEKVYMDRPFGLSGQGFNPPPTPVEDGTFSGEPYGSAYNTALEGMTEPSLDEDNNTVYIPKTEGLLDMANLLINTVDYSSAAEEEIFIYGYKSYLFCLSRAVALDIFEGNSSLMNEQLSGALGVFSAIENNNLQYQYSFQQKFYETNFAVGIDKCHLYRLFGQYNNAQSVLESISVQPQHFQTVDFISCHIENEKKLFDNQISWIEYSQNIQNCGVIYGINSTAEGIDTLGWGDTTQSSSGESSSALTYTIAPNPATSQTNVTINMAVDASVNVTIYNKFGSQVVPSINLGTLLTGSQTSVQVGLSGLPVDTYNMVVYADDIPYVQHFIKLAE